MQLLQPGSRPHQVSNGPLMLQLTSLPHVFLLLLVHWHCFMSLLSQGLRSLSLVFSQTPESTPAHFQSLWMLLCWQSSSNWKQLCSHVFWEQMVLLDGWHKSKSNLWTFAYSGNNFYHEKIMAMWLIVKSLKITSFQTLETDQQKYLMETLNTCRQVCKSLNKMIVSNDIL